MEIKKDDKYFDSDEKVYHIIDEIKGNSIYYHTIGKYHSLNNSEIRSISMFEELINKGFLILID